MNSENFRIAEAQLKALAHGGHRLTLQLSPTEALMLCGLLQLACRHPANDGITGAYGRDLVNTITLFFRDSPAVGKLIELGWTEDF